LPPRSQITFRYSEKKTSMPKSSRGRTTAISLPIPTFLSGFRRDPSLPPRLYPVTGELRPHPRLSREKESRMWLESVGAGDRNSQGEVREGIMEVWLRLAPVRYLVVSRQVQQEG
jgi:hypothetical protein